MRMLGAAIDLQLAINGAAEPVVRDHSFHGALDEQLGTTRSTLAEGFGFMTADKS